MMNSNSKNVTIKNEERNLGIDFLKAWMAFEVVLCHFGHGSDEIVFRYFFSYFRSVAVPVFMIVSFYLFAHFLYNKEWSFSKLTKRLRRIYLPLIAWALIYYAVYNGIAFWGNIKELYYPLDALFWQIMTGHSYNTPMWFNVVLVLLTVSLYFIVKGTHKYAVVVVSIVSLLTVFMLYIGLNNAFISMRSELNFPLGRIAEMIPFAGFGLLLYKFCNEKKIFYIIIFVCLAFLVKELCGCIYKGEIVSYHYNGMKLFICATLLVSVCVYTPLQKCPIFFKKVLSFLSRFSLGVYCIHMLVGTLMGFINIYIDPFYYSLLIYFVSLMVCYLVSKIPYKLFNDIVS